MLRLAWNTGKFVWSKLRDLSRAAADALQTPDKSQLFLQRRLAKALIIVSAVALFVWWTLPQFVWVRSPSIDAWAVRKVGGFIGRNDLVMFELRHPLAGPVPVNVTKYALCLPGDYLGSYTMHADRYPTRLEAAFFCNGRLIGVSKAYGKKGQRLDFFKWKDGPIPKGQAYIGSSYKDGFDSRYFGLVPISGLIRMERVL
ncbi:Type IV secretory pathway, protease TraF [Sphingobium sp. AP50]|uniref:S26 family signal peptidase n=1 Tax=Sphingobium sp. AP50 TaxID=1884369 RepID=UPI0008BE9C8B|nr:S26 family signal peptidase [Sphingobium sp. AP50]SEJ92335.1 Type IV secretory pathway, protease TraF [Sphingobium sp. AP50]